MTDPTREQMLAFLQAASSSTELWEVNEPHCIIETDPETNAQQVHGPFPDAYEAVRGALTLTEQSFKNHDAPYPTYRVCLFFTREQGGL